MSKKQISYYIKCILIENNEISDYITFPRSFEKYRWYKPILVFIVGLIISIILMGIIILAFYGAYGMDFLRSISTGGYEVLNTELGQIIIDLGVIVLLPSLYIATKIVRDRPFSSYSSSRGGWNTKLYLKAFIIPFIIIGIVQAIEFAITGSHGFNHFTIMFLIITIIMVPIQCIAEEYVFRGLIMQTFGSWFKIPIAAIIIQSIFFAAVHGYNSLGIIEVLITGIILGFLTWKTNGIEVSSAMHSANNLSISLFVMFGLKSTTSTIQLNDFIISVILNIALFAIMYYVGEKTNWFGEVEETSQNLT